MRVAFGVLAATLAVMPAVPAAAQTMPMRASGRLLSGICEASRDSCLAYVVGAVDAYVATQWVSGARLPFCIPAGATNEQLTQASVRYLRFHPERLDANAATLVVLALRDTYPCRAAAPPPPQQPRPQPRGR
jgi:hypothetical protein